MPKDIGLREAVRIQCGHPYQLRACSEVVYGAAKRTVLQDRCLKPSLPVLNMDAQVSHKATNGATGLCDTLDAAEREETAQTRASAPAANWLLVRQPCQQ